MKLRTCDKAVLAVLRRGKPLSGPEIAKALPSWQKAAVQNSCMQLCGQRRIDINLDWKFFLTKAQKG